MTLQQSVNLYRMSDFSKKMENMNVEYLEKRNEIKKHVKELESIISDLSENDLDVRMTKR